jgi:hypothetical protein
MKLQARHACPASSLYETVYVRTWGKCLRYVQQEDSPSERPGSQADLHDFLAVLSALPTTRRGGPLNQANITPGPSYLEVRRRHKKALGQCWNTGPTCALQVAQSFADRSTPRQLRMYPTSHPNDHNSSPGSRAVELQINLAVVEGHYRNALRPHLWGRARAAHYAAIRDIPCLLNEIERLWMLLAEARIRHADLRAAALATISAYDAHELDPLFPLRAGLSGDNRRGWRPRNSP